MKFIIVLAFILIQMSCLGQDSTAKKTHKNSFGLSVYGGLLEGQSGTSFNIQTVGGVRRLNWYYGLGAGLDHYFLRSMPVFASVNRYLISGKNRFFVQGEAGANFVLTTREINRGNNVINDKFLPGLYWSGGIGFSTPVGKRNAVMFNVGYSFKQITEDREKAVQCLVPPCPPSNEHYKYDLRRIGVKIGWFFSGD